MTEGALVVDQDGAYVSAPRTEATHLAWGVKPSFLRYVEGVGGEVECRDGATATGDGFAFPLVGRGDGAVSARGAVRIRAHGGLLDLQIIDPALVTVDRGEALTVAAGSSRRTVGIAPLPIHRGGDSAALTLHADAVALFGDTYGPGTELDPVRFLTTRTLPRAS